TKVTIKPVIDLNTNLTTDSYVPSTAIAEQVDLRDRRCVFPFCTRTRTDRDHRIPYDTGGDTGGQTESTNIARLCRGHHRAKTFSTWTYDIPAPGVYVWHSPAGNTLLVDRTAEP
ncbi:HNH endonuclease signature motif containing protein, partial [Nocardioides sp.]|uniref:HNH endonuclease signature motif containing protein n=1 Tax=Nocardioides sp. TaxID=35761 RepID=UPI00271631DC